MTTKLAHASQDLADLQHIGIVIEDLDPDSESVGLTKQFLSDMVLVGLKRDVPKLKIDNESVSSFFYVQITTVTLNNGTACAIDVALERPAMIVGDNGKIFSTVAKVWDKGSLLKGPTSGTASRIRDFINDFVTAFAAQYYKDNP